MELNALVTLLVAVLAGFVKGFVVKVVDNIPSPHSITTPSASSLFSTTTGSADAVLLAGSDCISTDHAVILPFFPLRKAVRLPSESLALNLYEDRYLALAEFVLGTNRRHSPFLSSSPRGVFAVLYTGQCPQFIHRGTGLITPLLTPGDVGVVFRVKESEEANIPTIGGSTNRRRIRLEAVGTHRFRLRRTIHHGFDDNTSGADEKHVPFILVEASLIADPPLSPQEMEEFNRLLATLSVRKKNLFSPPFVSDKMNLTSYSIIEAATRIIDQKYLVDNSSTLSSSMSLHFHEIISFDLVSRMMKLAGTVGDTRARQQALRSQSSLERLRWSLRI